MIYINKGILTNVPSTEVNMKLLKKHWRLLCGCYVFIYLPWFFALERMYPINSPKMHILDTAFDKALPFLEIFIVPYMLWFLYIVATCVYMFFKADDKEFFRLAATLILGMTTTLIICMIYPNGVTLRPDISTLSDTWFGNTIKGLWATDTSTNVFPSVHCYNSMAAHMALAHCKAFKKHKVLNVLSLILCISICLSTMFLKQHSVLDFLGAILLMSIMYYFFYIRGYAKVRKTVTTVATEE